MFPSNVLGAMGLELDKRIKGRTPLIGWLMLREMRKWVPFEPK
jgi:hypothetical protein